MKIIILSGIILILFSNSVFAKSLNIYSHRQPYLLKPFLDAYTKKTGVKLNVVTKLKTSMMAMTANPIGALNSIPPRGKNASCHNVKCLALNAIMR